MESKSKAKKVLSVLLNIILWVYVIFCVLVTVVAVSASENAKNVPTIAGKCVL